MGKGFGLKSVAFALVIVWAGSLYLAQDWGYGRNEGERQVLLCEDALQRRIDIYRRLNEPVAPGMPGGQVSLLTFASSNPQSELYAEAEHLVNMYDISDEAIERFCGKATG